jgi:NAD(P)-dependent dehydrogenase (short-subunit alcohol dehydrogenase family)
VAPSTCSSTTRALVSSARSRTLAAMPLAGVYTASKTAIEGLQALWRSSLLAAFNIRVKLV